MATDSGVKPTIVTPSATTDAMMAAAPLIAAIEEIALATVTEAGEPGRATVGRLTVYPDSRNIAPSRIWFSIDTRHHDPALLARMAEEPVRRVAIG